jgi:hypothetical protein
MQNWAIQQGSKARVLLHHVPPAYSRHGLIILIGNSPLIVEKAKRKRVPIQNVEGIRLPSDDSFFPLRFFGPKHHIIFEKKKSYKCSCIHLSAVSLSVLSFDQKYTLLHARIKRQATECEVARNIELANRGIE